MTTLRSENRVLAYFLVVVLVFGILTTLYFYYEVYEINSRGKKISVSSPDTENRPKAGLLLEYRDISVADELAAQVRVLCWVMAQPGHNMTLQFIKATWGKRCNHLLFISTAQNKSAQTQPERSSDEIQWTKTKAAFRYVHQRHRDDADWFLKADDDTYVIVENLRYMLAGHNSSDPIQFACKFKHRNQRYMSGGAGYVLSRGALDKLVDEGLSGRTLCIYEHGQKDLEMGKCLSRIGVVSGATHNSLRRGNLFPFKIDDHLFPVQDQQYWNWNFFYYPTTAGLDCSSEYAISFHYMDPHDMYVLDYLIYQLRPYGVAYKTGTKQEILDKVSKNVTHTKLILNSTGSK